MQELDTETKTVLHYAKKIKEFCDKKDRCGNCPFFNCDSCDCYFDSTPNMWQEVDLHE